MAELEYRPLDQALPDELIALMNSPAVRRHLMPFPGFDHQILNTWLEAKRTESLISGTYIRAVFRNNVLIGWCGIQPSQAGFEIAIILASGAWGCGRQVYRHLLQQAAELGHKSLLVYLPQTRRSYRFLNDIAEEREPVSIGETEFRCFSITV